MEKTQKKPRQYSVEFKLCAILDKLVERLFKKLPVGVEPLLHSDQGWQYQMN